MECNKDDAARAKDIAERRLNAKDFAGARKFALKARTLYPGLEGVSQLVATLDVYASAENKINGEVDWYGILGVTPHADDDTVRKHYRKLALMLHPDKNKSVGAEGAFKFISEAWSLLSDKAKRAAYDQKRDARVFQQKVKHSTDVHSMASGSNGFYNFAKTTASSAKVSKESSWANKSFASTSTHKPKGKTFWTVCHRCKMQYEYLRVYLNHNLLCPNCHQPFFAIETAPPLSNGSKSSAPWNSSQHRKNSNHHEANKNVFTSQKNMGSNAGYSTGGFQWAPFSRTGGASTVAQAASVVQQTYERVKREREEAQAARKREKAVKRKKYMSDLSYTEKKRTGGSMSSWHGFSTSNQIGRNNLAHSRKELSQVELQNMLMEKARKEIQRRVTEWQSTTAVNNAGHKENVNEKIHEKDKANEGAEANCNRFDLISRESVDTRNGSSDDVFNANSGSDFLEPLSINVPDSDFHDFDRDRTEKAFGENQIWAAYDDDDGMPRYYAMIHSIISRDPFKMRISWLNSRTNIELSPINWIGSGFSKTCGEFRVGKYEINHSLNSFSHKVTWTKDARGEICIFPRKGDVWALYRNWSSDWSELTPNEVVHKYDMVEVLEDYDDKLGVFVVPLVKVAGFKTVFHRHLDPDQVRRIPREETFRFSHQIPSYMLMGQEASSAPKGCRELDPAATPVDLLHVITVEIEDIAENEASSHGEATNDSVKTPTEAPVITGETGAAVVGNS